MAVRAVLLDIDGVLTLSWRPLPGAVEALAELRSRGLRVALVTNTTSRDRAWIVAGMQECGFDVTADDVLTAPMLAADYLTRHHPGGRCLLVNSGDLSRDLAGLEVEAAAGPARGGEPARGEHAAAARVDVVLLGGAGPEFGYETLNRVFALWVAGAELVTMNRNLTWATEQGLQLDTGAFLLGLERAGGRMAVDVGKPSPAFFRSALSRVGVDPAEAMMVGDDLDSDVLAAQAVGLRGVLVRTGKYRHGSELASTPRPDHVVDSVADVPALLDADRPS